MAPATPRSPAPSFHFVWGGISQRIFVFSAMQAWTAEEGGRIRCTTDGGATWQFQPTPNEIDGYVRSISFLRRGPLSGKRGWAVGSNGRLITTADGGLNWALVGDPLLYPAGDPLAGRPCDLFDVFFQDTLNGWVSGIRVLRRTLDGGQSWIDLMPLNPNVPSLAELYRFAFIGPGPGLPAIAVAEPGLILRSVDGTTWSTVSEDLEFCPNLPEDLELWDVQFENTGIPNTAVGYVVGGQGNQCGGMLSTTDGGQSWVRELSANLPPTVYGVTPLSAGGALACGYGGRAYRRAPNVDPEWTDISALLEPPMPDVRVPMWGAGGDGASTAWLVGLMNHVYKTSDKGSSWVKQRGAGAWRMRDIHFADANTGWAVAQLLTVLRTQDGGSTWIEELAMRGPNLNAVRLRDATHGVVVGGPAPGGAPAILYYDPALAPDVWREITLVPTLPPPPNVTLWSAVWAHVGSNIDAWAVGTSAAVLRSTDGSGQTWSYFSSPPGSAGVEFLSIAFDGVDALYLVGMRRSSGTTCAYRLRYPALVWEDLTQAGVFGVWRAVVAQGTDVYAAGSTSPTEGVVYKFDPASAPGAPIWNVVYPTSAAPSPQVLYSAALVGQGANQTLFVGGERGMVLRLQGGLWVSMKSQTSVTLTGMSFLSPARGFAVGHGSLDGQGVGSPIGLGDSAMVGYS